MTTRVAISTRTWVLALVGALGLVAFAFIVFAPPADPQIARLLAYVDTLFIVAAAIVIMRVATSFAAGDALWRQWMFIGLGVASFAFGDIIWAFYELVLHRPDPTPGLPDVFYVITTVLLAIGVIRAAMAFRRVGINVRAPLLITCALVIALVMGESAFVLRGVVSDPALSLAAKTLSVYYPLADIALLFGPAVFIVLVVLRLGRGSLGWPWWAVAAGLACMSVADTVFSAMQISGSYIAGSPVDIGWMAGHLLLAVGA
jgi:diguanylate cyclase